MQGLELLEGADVGRGLGRVGELSQTGRGRRPELPGMLPFHESNTIISPSGQAPQAGPEPSAGAGCAATRGKHDGGIMAAMKPIAGRAGEGVLQGGAGELGCEVCGRLPAPSRARLTLANLAMMVPIELLVNAAAVNTDLPFALKVLVLTAATSVLAIWVAEPPVMRLLRQWLHAPALRRRKRLGRAVALWRIRTVLEDEPGSLEHLARALARSQVNILDIQVHPSGAAVLDELVASAPEGMTEGDLGAVVAAGGGRETRVWPTTALALADTATQALSLALRVVADPGELPLAAAEMLRARVLDSRRPHPDAREGTVLKIPSPWTGAHVFIRPGEPFTPAERARANRLAQLAELASPGSRARPRHPH